MIRKAEQFQGWSMAKDARSRPWKRNFREIPQTVRAALSRISEDLVVVAATKVIPFPAIAGGVYHHLGLTGEGGTVVAGPPAIPPADGGRFSNNNVYGWEVVRKDLPMIVKTYTWETPNFGDAATYGTHMHYQDREVYQREYFEPRDLKVSVEVLLTSR